MSTSSSQDFEAWARALRSPFLQETIQSRLAAVAHFQEAATAAVPFLCAMMANEDETEVGRIWAAISLENIKPEATEELLDASSRALATKYASLRRAVLNLLGATGSAKVVPLVRDFVDDHEQDPLAWFDDDCTVSHAAQAALRRVSAKNVHASEAGA